MFSVAIVSLGCYSLRVVGRHGFRCVPTPPAQALVKAALEDLADRQRLPCNISVLNDYCRMRDRCVGAVGL